MSRVAASLLLADGAVGQVLVVDLDVHQGDGTADILARRAARLHLLDARRAQLPGAQDRLRPRHRACRTAPATRPISSACGRCPCRSSPARTAPDIVFYNAGVDPHADDRLGRLALTDEGLRPARQHGDRAISASRGIPVCGVIGGGYGADVRALAARHAILFEVAAEFA